MHDQKATPQSGNVHSKVERYTQARGQINLFGLIHSIEAAVIHLIQLPLSAWLLAGALITMQRVAIFLVH